MTTSYPLHEILGLIEQGVALMGAKKYNQACTSLTRALQINKETLLSEMADSQQNDEASLCDNASLWMSCELLSFIVTRSNSMVGAPDDQFNESLILDDNNSENTDRSIYVYSTPLAVMACDQESDFFRKTPSRDVQTILSLVIIFNLALSNHLYALEQTKKGGCSLTKRRSWLSRAYALYEHSKALQYQLKLEACWFFSLMVINNEAQVLSLIGEHEGAEELLQGILSGLCCLNRHYREENESLPPIASLEGFSHNTSFLILKEVITAAAA